MVVLTLNFVVACAEACAIKQNHVGFSSTIQNKKQNAVSTQIYLTIRSLKSKTGYFQ